MRYDGGTLNPRMTELRERRRQVRLALAAGVGTGSQKYHTTDKVRNMDVNVQSALDAAAAAQSDATDAQSTASQASTDAMAAQSAVAAMATQIGYATVVAYSTTAFHPVGQIGYVSPPTHPGMSAVLVTLNVVGRVFVDAPVPPDLQVQYFDVYGRSQVVSWPLAYAGDVTTYPGAGGGMWSLNGSASITTQPGLSIWVVLAYPTSPSTDPATWDTGRNGLYVSARLDYAPTAPVAMMAALSTQPAATQATTDEQSTDIKEQSS